MANISYCSDKQSAVKVWNKRASDWIPCSERMPRGGIFVLVVGSDGIVFMASVEGDHWGSYDGYLPYEYEEITHWMPLPEPPKGA